MNARNTTKRKRLCGIVYDGPSYPELHGAKCSLPKGHDNGPPHGDARHVAYCERGPVSWYTTEQKAARAAEKAAQ